VGPYVKKHAVVRKHYTTVNMLRTMEDVLGTQHLNLNTAYQRPMTDVFDTDSDGTWTYTATASTILKTTTLVKADIAGGGVRYAAGPNLRSTHSAAYWAKHTEGFDFSDADRVPAQLMNKVLWDGLRPGRPYPKQFAGVPRDATEVSDD
jgi:hypothetical protein